MTVCVLNGHAYISPLAFIKNLLIILKSLKYWYISYIPRCQTSYMSKICSIKDSKEWKRMVRKNFFSKCGGDVLTLPYGF